MQNTHRYKIKQNFPDLWIADFPWKKLLGHKYSRGRVVVYGGKKGVHSEYFGYLLSDLQYMQRTYPNMTW